MGNPRYTLSLVPPPLTRPDYPSACGRFFCCSFSPCPVVVHGAGVFHAQRRRRRGRTRIAGVMAGAHDCTCATDVRATGRWAEMESPVPNQCSLREDKLTLGDKPAAGIKPRPANSVHDNLRYRWQKTQHVRILPTVFQSPPKPRNQLEWDQSLVT